MATWIKADGTVSEVRPAHGKKFRLEELQRYVGGYIELVKTRKPVRNMYLNEDGLGLNLPVNRKATERIDPRYLVVPPGVRGDVIVCERGEG